MEILALCGRIAAGLPGAAAVVLVGSHARGTATAESDVDLLALGAGTDEIGVREGRLVTISWRTEAEQRRRFARARSAVAEVPAWRAAVPVADPAGVAAALVREAAAWTWDRVAADAAEAVADDLVGLAEEVHKLAAALRRGRPRTAAVQRALLALHVPMAAVLHHGVLYASENDVWDLVAERAGAAWAADQDAALGVSAVAHDEGCRAALRLYASLAGSVRATLDRRRAAVVDAATKMVGAACRSGAAPFDA